MNEKHTRAGFSLLELLIVVAIISLMTALLVPQFMSMQPAYTRKQFVSKINALVQFGLQQAVISKKVHRVLFDIKKRTALLEVESEKSTPSKIDFEAIKGSYIPTSMSWPDSIVIKQLLIEGFDEMKRFTGGKTHTVWFYIIPGGMAQAVTINFVDKEQLIDGKPKPVGLVLNPFTVEFKVHHAFQK